jgi:hypothetical protein
MSSSESEEVLIDDDQSYEPLLNLTEPYAPTVNWSLLEDFVPQSIPAWHSSSHEKTRDVVRQQISFFILQVSEWFENLHEVSCKLDQRLYHMATCLEEYSDPLKLVEK